MREFLIGAVISLAGAGAALAQAPVTPLAAQVRAGPWPTNSTRDEAWHKMREHFAQLDGDRDGFRPRTRAAGRKVIISDSAKGGPNAVRNAWKGEDPKIAFDRLDSNKDGAISRDEFAKGREARIERRIVMHDGQPGSAGGAHRACACTAWAGMLAATCSNGRCNRDGRVSLQEATDSAVRHFDTAGRQPRRAGLCRTSAARCIVT